MARTKFIMIGGFLGAGKTTTIGRLAAMFQQRGQQVGIVTNDQATDLVDTHSLRSQGFDVGEVAGACFCCDFNELTATVARLDEKNRPDVILAEPVGSCTDLVATVVRPLERLFDERFDVAPYGVILKPNHGRRILENLSNSGFSPKAAYIFRKQLEEADFVLLNRADELLPEEIDRLSSLIQREYPGMNQLHISAKTGQGFDKLLAMLDRPVDSPRKTMALDYDIYAAGEAELGWLNSSIRVSADAPFDLDRLLVDMVERLKALLSSLEAETAHVKTIGLWEGFYGVANLSSSNGPVELSLPSDCQPQEAEVIVNARVAIDPETLQAQVEQAVTAACRQLEVQCEFRQTQSFRPGRPVPTHRIGGDTSVRDSKNQNPTRQ